MWRESEEMVKGGVTRAENGEGGGRNLKEEGKEGRVWLGRNKGGF